MTFKQWSEEIQFKRKADLYENLKGELKSEFYEAAVVGIIIINLVIIMIK